MTHPTIAILPDLLEDPACAGLQARLAEGQTISLETFLLVLEDGRTQHYSPYMRSILGTFPEDTGDTAAVDAWFAEAGVEGREAWILVRDGLRAVQVAFDANQRLLARQSRKEDDVFARNARWHNRFAITRLIAVRRAARAWSWRQQQAAGASTQVAA